MDPSNFSAEEEFAPVGPSPPRAKAAVCVPQPAIAVLALFKFPLFVQVDPLYFSVDAFGPFPPKPTAAVCVPAPAKFALAVFKLPPLDQAP